MFNIRANKIHLHAANRSLFYDGNIYYTYILITISKTILNKHNFCLYNIYSCNQELKKPKKKEKEKKMKSRYC